MQRPLLVAAALATLTLASPRNASACGGTFCDLGPPGSLPMPIDQRGENIAFVIGDDHIDAHVQIQYKGNPDRFAWLIPLPTTPEVRIGSQLFFDALLAGTSPRFAATTASQLCTGGDSGRVSSGCGSRDAFGSAGSLNDADATPATPTVTRHDVGSFEIHIIEGGTTQALLAWLEDNGYLTPASAAPIIEGYVQKGHVFVGVKIRRGADSDEIHPLVFRYEGQTPCIPLKLTAIAAVEDMAVRAFFLDSKRWFPKNWAHVTPNSLRFAFPPVPTFPSFFLGNAGSSGASAANPSATAVVDAYFDVIARAVDSPGASGRAFVTEYAGRNNINLQPLQTAAYVVGGPVREPIDTLVRKLQFAGLLTCNAGSDTCQSPEPSVLAVLHELLPVPDGISETDFYRCPGCADKRYTTLAVDPLPLARAIEQRVAIPCRDAARALGDSTVITRLVTAISPAEMTEDPEFLARDQQDPAFTRPTPQVIYQATYSKTCADQTTLLTDEAEVLVDPSAPTDGARVPLPATMPFASLVEQIPESGPPIVMADNRAHIAREADAYNASLGGIVPGPQLVTSSRAHCAAQRAHAPRLPLAFALLALTLLLRRSTRT